MTPKGVIPMYEAPEYRYRKDCFAYRDCRCAALKRFYNAGAADQCAGCPFYKTRKRFAEENKRCLERAKRLAAKGDAEKEEYIERSYEALLQGKTYYPNY